MPFLFVFIFGFRILYRKVDTFISFLIINGKKFYKNKKLLSVSNIKMKTMYSDRITKLVSVIINELPLPIYNQNFTYPY